jgi:hypothetical protein
MYKISIKANRLMLLREIVSVYSENQEAINILCVQNSEFMDVKGHFLYAFKESRFRNVFNEAKWYTYIVLLK